MLQVSDGYPPATGGMERVVEALSKQLVAQGHTAVVATLSRPDALPYEESDGVAIHRLSGFERHLRRFATDPAHTYHPTCPDPALVRRLQRLVEDVRPDVIHTHGWILNSCLSLRLPPTTALVHTLHDYGLICAKKTLIRHESLDAVCPGPQVRRCLSCAAGHYGALKGSALTTGLWESRRRFSRVSMFLPISSAVRYAALPDDVPDEKICVVPSFVADTVFDEARDTPRPEFLPRQYILFVGALGEHKGVSLLADAHRRMRTSLPLVYIGPAGPDTPELAGTADRPIIVRTGVPHDEIMAALSAATVAVVPSRWQEPLGLVAIEAMAAGTPVVVTRVGALPEVIEHHRTGLVVEPGNPTALAEALDTIVTDPPLARRYGDAGRRRARRYTAAAVLPQLLEAYERALRRHLLAF